MSGNNEKQEFSPNDGRLRHDWESRYQSSAWIQIGIELFYLIILLIFSTLSLFVLGSLIEQHPSNFIHIVHEPFYIAVSENQLRWICVALAGVVGGLTFDMKWLYHSVASGYWSKDRVLWRLLVPIISGIVALFLSFMIVSGLVPFIRTETFNSLYFGLGIGFL